MTFARSFSQPTCRSYVRDGDRPGGENRREFDGQMSRLAFTCLVLVACGSSPSSTSEPDARPADLANDASACGVRTSQRGKTSRTLRVAGLDRTYIVYLPDSDPLTPMPLVYVHHGYSMSGQAM